MMKNKKAQVSIYMAFMITAIIIVLIAAFMAPMGVLINTEFYAAGEELMLEANESINNIDDATVRQQIQDVITEGLSAQQNNIEVNSDIFQYSWILVIGLTALVVFLYTRRIVAFSGGGFVG